MTQTTNRTKVSRSTLEKENLLSVESEKIEMTLNTDSAVAQGLLIQRLTELYEDPIEATVRETISNALDAVAVEFSGDKAVVEVESPSELHPILVVRDNGVGMTYEDLKNVYSKYGASTKLNNFDQIGAYGLGAKAPLAYGTQFTVSSVRDGIKTTIIVVREELTNYIRVIETGETDEPSGTTVSVPVSNKDINAFVAQVKKYKDAPVDYNAELYIDSKLVTGENFALIDEEVVVFSKNGEEVKARLWLKIDESKIVQLLTNIDEGSLKQNLKLVIGGWVYNSPKARSYYSNGNSPLYVELKPGIVAFNSARDAVLSNERYIEFENLIVKYVKSEQFLKKMTKTINTLEVEAFKRVVVALLGTSLNSIYIDDNNEISVKNTHNSYTFMHNFQISDFVHEETGFNFKDITSGVPTSKKDTAIVMVSKAGYKTTYDYSAVVPSEKNRMDRTRNLRASDAGNFIEGVFDGTNSSGSLASLMVNMALYAYGSSNRRTDASLTIITDVVVPVDYSKSNYKKVISGRKSIVDMSCDKHSFNHYLVYTKHTKAEIEKMIKSSELKIEAEVYTVDEAAEKVSEHRKANRSSSGTRDVNKDFSVRIETFDGDNMNTTKVLKIGDIDSKEKNIFIASRDRFIPARELTSLLNGYCNEKKIKTTEVKIYSLVGNLRVIEMEALEGLGEVFEYKKSKGAGTSKTYKEKVADKHIEPSPFSIFDENLEKKAFIRLLNSIANENLKTSSSRLEREIKAFSEVAKELGVTIETPDFSKVLDLQGFSVQEYGQHPSYHFWTLSTSEIQTYMKALKEDKRNLIEFFFSLRNNQKPFHNDNEVYVLYGQDVLPNKDNARVAALTPNCFSSKLLIESFKIFANLANEQIKTMNNLTF